MDKKSKAKLVKSKSSNSAITSRSDKGSSSNKKSRSSAEFKSPVCKKRGMYVEKRPSGGKHAMNIDDKNGTKLKAPPRSRPGTKTFLASVLTILSKSTASTQFPPIQEPKTRNKQKKIAPSKQASENQRPKMVKNVSNKNDTNDEPSVKKAEEHPESSKKKKPKYKSRVLNEVSKKSSQKVLVLQSKKDIVQTPSCNSKSTKEMSEHSIKWADFLPKLIDSATGVAKNVLEKNYDPQEHGIAKSVLEGTQFNLDKKAYDPTTLVSSAPKDEKLYSLFVDLLETVYNVKPEFNASGLKSVKSSKIQLEIDDSVAQRLEIPNKIPETIECDHHITAPKPQYVITPGDNEDWDTKKLAEYFNNKPVSVEWSEPYLQKTCKCARKKIKPDLYTVKKKVAAKTQSAIIDERKALYKKNKKQDLLNILKEQLKMDDGGRDDPDNFYQALRVIARNKRKQNAIHFDDSAKGGSDYDSCIFKRRKVISPSTRMPKRPKGNRANDFFRIPVETKSVDSEYTRTMAMAESAIHCNESNHSLEVTGFDYEVKLGLPAMHGPPVYSNSASESDLESSSKITNWNLGFKTMTQQWK